MIKKAEVDDGNSIAVHDNVMGRKVIMAADNDIGPSPHLRVLYLQVFSELVFEA